jgi:hypothetical protein
VLVGRTRFSRCCYLIIDLGSHLFDEELGQELVAVTWTRRLSSAVKIPHSPYATAATTLWLFRSGS